MFFAIVLIVWGALLVAIVACGIGMRIERDRYRLRAQQRIFLEQSRLHDLQDRTMRSIWQEGITIYCCGEPMELLDRVPVAGVSEAALVCGECASEIWVVAGTSDEVKPETAGGKPCAS